MSQYYVILLAELLFGNSLSYDLIDDVDKQQILCMTDNIYHEGRGEGKSGWLAIANVVTNRVDSDHFPNSVCKVVYQNKQFEWTSKSNKKIKNKKLYKNIRQFSTKYYIKYKLNKQNNIVGDSVYYRTKKLDKRQAKSIFSIHKLKKNAVIGNHVFYGYV